MKTNKSYSKRLKHTKTGKIIGRVVGQNHFNAKQRGEERAARRGVRQAPAAFARTVKKRFLPKK